MDAIAIRTACPEDLAAIAVMQRRSLLALAMGDYAPAAVEAMATHLPTLNPALVADGTLLVAETASGRVLGSAGWSRRPVDDAIVLDRTPSPFPPQLDPVGTVRSVFVDPSVARRGLGRRLMARLEHAMAASGCVTAELLGTLPAERLYRTLGYTALTTHGMRLPGGQLIRVRRMARRLHGAADRIPLAA